jgi:hypothetical protein
MTFYLGGGGVLSGTCVGVALRLTKGWATGGARGLVLTPSTRPTPRPLTAAQVPLAEASARCRHGWMRDALHTWATRRGWAHLLPAPAPAPPSAQPSPLKACGGGADGAAGAEAPDMAPSPNSVVNGVTSA